MTTIKYTSFKYIAEIVIWCDEALENFGFAIKGASAPKNLQFKDCDTAKSEARKLVKQLKKEALDNNLGAIQGVNITSDYLVTPNEPQTTSEPPQTTPETVVDEYEAKRKALITEWQELETKINNEKDAKNNYECQCQKQGIEPDDHLMRKFKFYVAALQDLQKQIDTKIKDLDSVHGKSDLYYYGLD